MPPAVCRHRLPPQPAAAPPRPAGRHGDWLLRAGTLRSRLARGLPGAVQGLRHEASTSPPPSIIRFTFAQRYPRLTGSVSTAGMVARRMRGEPAGRGAAIAVLGCVLLLGSAR